MSYVFSPKNHNFGSMLFYARSEQYSRLIKIVSLEGSI